MEHDPFDCQEFHELCMDYRGAQYGSSVNAPQQAYERLQKYCRDAMIERHAKLREHAEAMAGWIEANEGPFPDPIGALVNFRADFPKG